MAIPFGDYYNSGKNFSKTPKETLKRKRKDVLKESNGKENNSCSGTTDSLQCPQFSVASTQGSHRAITFEDIGIVAKAVEEDWRKLVKNLPGVTSNNLNYHQVFIDAMDRGDNTNMAEIALSTWKDVLPQLSTIGNLSKTLYSIGHPYIVAHLKP